MNLFFRLSNILFKPPSHKFYSDWTPFERAWWSLWKRPSDCFSMEDVIKLNFVDRNEEVNE